VALVAVACGGDDGEGGADRAASAPATEAATGAPQQVTPTATSEATTTTSEPTSTAEPTATATPTPAPMMDATGETVTVEPVRDNTLYESTDAPDAQKSNGAGAHLFVGLTNSGSARRALVRFDVADAVPAGATIVGVELQMTVSRTTTGGKTTVLHRLLSDWGEQASDASANEGGGSAPEPDDATWMYAFFGTEQWDAPGGDFASEASASSSIGGVGGATWESTDGLIADVQAWLDDPESNFGWIVIGDESGGSSSKRFNSRENGDAGSRPILTIRYTTEG
jgi:hypothetical protein